MKKGDVPQDDANMFEGKLREPCYALDEKGRYTTIKSVGWEPKNIVMQDAWDVINDRIEEVKKEVTEGKRSPIAYYMEKNLMDIKILAAYVGLWKFTVKKHLKMKGFDKLSDETLKKYADTFDIEFKTLKNKELH